MFNNLAIILVEPQGDLNIGSVCRAMLNFGCKDLRLVSPRVDHLTDAARRMAVKATPILENATICSDLATAVADRQLIFGTTRRTGKYRDAILLPEIAAEKITSGSNQTCSALMFGREEDGLTNSELDRCHYMVTIPSSTSLPSLNLAQAVTICLYEMFRAAHTETPSAIDTREPATAAELEEMIQQMRDVLLRRGFLDKNNPDHILRTFRHIFGRSELNSREVRILRGLWSNLENSSGRS